MITIKTMPKETLAELLFFLADNERFTAVNQQLKGSVTVEEVRSALRELATEVQRTTQGAISTDETFSTKNLSSEARDALSSLSSNEEELLLSAFGLTD